MFPYYVISMLVIVCWSIRQHTVTHIALLRAKVVARGSQQGDFRAVWGRASLPHLSYYTHETSFQGFDSCSTSVIATINSKFMQASSLISQCRLATKEHLLTEILWLINGHIHHLCHLCKTPCPNKHNLAASILRPLCVGVTGNILRSTELLLLPSFL